MPTLPCHFCSAGCDASSFKRIHAQCMVGQALDPEPVAMGPLLLSYSATQLLNPPHTCTHFALVPKELAS